VRNALRRANYASLVSPVTGLPGKEVADDRLRQLLKEDGWAVLSVTLADMEPFNEAYGFVAGDDVLRAVGLILSNVVDEVGTLEDFVGHVGPSDFLLITRENKAGDIRDKLAARLERAFNYFYPIKDIESGQVAAPMQAEVGIAVASSGPFADMESIYKASSKAREVIASSHS
jgi:GGDEF domain-containing protein